MKVVFPAIVDPPETSPLLVLSANDLAADMGKSGC